MAIENEKEFVGVYRAANKPNQRIPVHKIGGDHIDILGNKIDISKLVKIDEPTKSATTLGA